MTGTTARRPSISGAAVGGLVAIVVGGAIGVAIRGSSTSSPTTTTTVTTARATSAPASGTAVGDLRVVLPTGWRRTSTPLAVPGLGGPRSLGFTASEGSAVLAQVDAADRSLLPAQMLAALGAETADLAASGTPALIGDVRVLSYVVTVPALVRVYALPTTRGVAVLACTSDFTTCPDLLTGVKVTGGSVLALGPDAALRSRLAGVVAELSAVRQAQRTVLADATDPSGRSTAADALGQAYRMAGATLAPLAAGGPQSVDTIQALRRVWRDYDALGAAAKAQDGPAFQRAGATVTADEAEVDRLLAAWRVDA